MPKTLRPQSHARKYEVMRRIAASQTQQQIAAALSVKVSVIRDIRRRNGFEAELDAYVGALDERHLQQMRDAALPSREVMRMAALEAAFKIIDLMRSAASPELQFKAAKEVCDRGEGSLAPGGITVNPAAGGQTVIIDKFEQLNIAAGLEGVKTMAAREADGTAVVEAVISGTDAAATSPTGDSIPSLTSFAAPAVTKTFPSAAAPPVSPLSSSSPEVPAAPSTDEEQP